MGDAGLAFFRLVRKLIKVTLGILGSVKEAATTLPGAARSADGLKDRLWYEMQGDWTR